MTQWDARKNASNKAKHGVGFEAFAGFQWDHAECFAVEIVAGEEREVWVGPIGNTLHVAVMTQRGGDNRLISLRKATQREIKLWRNTK